MRYEPASRRLLMIALIVAGCTGSSREVTTQGGGSGVGAAGGAAGANPSGSSGVAPGGEASTGGAGLGGTGESGMAGSGAMTSDGGMSAGTGAVGGSAAGTDGEGGSPDGGAGAGGEGSIGIADLAGALDGRLILVPCQDRPSSNDCAAVHYIDGAIYHCLHGQLVMDLRHPMGGTPGALYRATMHFYGIMETRYYGPDATRDAGATRPVNADEGADPAPFAVGVPGMAIPDSNRVSYEIHVLDDEGQEVGVYFVNSDTEATETARSTYVIDYERAIPVVGGGIVSLRAFQRSCRITKNCGSSGEHPCGDTARTLDVSAVDPAVPPPAAPEDGGFSQPGMGNPPDHSGQWWLIDVTKVEAM